MDIVSFIMAKVKTASAATTASNAATTATNAKDAAVAAKDAAELAQARAETYGEQVVVVSEYDSTETYDLGEYVMHNNTVYECTTAITTAEAWNSAHWTAASVGTDSGIVIWG